MSSILSSPRALVDQLEDRIYLIRGHKVMIDADLGHLYGVLTKNLNKAVQRNRDRFPADFMFRLSKSEAASLRFQIGTSNSRGGSRYLPYAFTEEGVAMLSSVLRSTRAVRVNIAIMRAFVRLRSILAMNKVLARKIDAMEHKYDSRSEVITDLIKKYLKSPAHPGNKIGFRTNDK
ncbi:MAG: ORF6N domain-containing protein [Acidobacteriota bacterium]